jgi:PAS domain S-box-containing protein
MNKLIIVIVFLMIANVLCSLNLTEEELFWIEQHKVIRIAPDPDFPPIEWIDENGNYQGITSEYMQLISKMLKIKFELVRCNTWDEVLQKARNREIDLLTAAAQTPQRAEYMNFSEAYLTFPGVIVTAKHNSGLIDSKSLNGKDVAVVSGYIWQEMLNKDYPLINIIPVENIADGLRKVSLSEVDAMVATLPIAIYYIEKEGIHNLIIAGETEYFTRLSIQTRNDWPILKNLIQKALDNIPDAKRKRIQHKWINIQPSARLLYSYFWKYFLISILIVTVIIGLVLIWNRSLKTQVKNKTLELQADIAKRIEAEKALIASEEKYKLLIDNQVDLIVKTDTESRFLFVSPSFCRMFGLSESELLGSSILPLVHPDYQLATKAEIRKVLSPPYRCYIEHRANTKDGWKWLAWQGKAVLDEDKEITAIIGLGRDITEQKQAELENTQLAEIIRNSQEGIILTDEKGKITFVNEAFERMSGFSFKEIQDRDPIEFVVTDDQKKLAIEIRSRVYEGKHWVGEMICRKKNGEHYFIETQVFPIFDTAGNMASIAAIQNDISIRKRTEKELEENRKLLENEVESRTAELKKKYNELESLNKLFIGRENRMIELKEEIAFLKEKIKKHEN